MWLNDTPPPPLRYRYEGGRWEIDAERSHSELAGWRDDRRRDNLLAAVALGLGVFAGVGLLGAGFAGLVLRFVPW